MKSFFGVLGTKYVEEFTVGASSSTFTHWGEMNIRSLFWFNCWNINQINSFRVITMFITTIIASLSWSKLTTGKKKSLKKKNSLLLHSLIKHRLVLENLMTVKSPARSRRIRTWKWTLSGIKRSHQSYSGYLSGYRHAADLLRFVRSHVD